MAVTLNFDPTDNKDLLRGGLRKIFNAKLNNTLFQAPNMFKMKSTDEYITRDFRMTGLSGHQSLTDGEVIPTQEPTADRKLDYTQSRYGTGFKITSGMKKFNKIDLVAKLTKSLARAMKEAKDVDVADIYNSATSTDIVGFDNLALASDSHTILNGSDTYDNYGNVALSYTGLQDATIYFDELVDDSGDTRPWTPDTVAVNTRYRFKLRKYLGTDGEPDTADNNTNALTDEYKLKPFVYHRLTSSTSWFMLAKNDEDFDVQVLTAQEPDILVQDTTDGSRSILVTSEQWYAKGFGEPRGVYIGSL